MSDGYFADAAAIVGVAQSEFVRNIGRPEAQTAVAVVQAALADAGLRPDEVDGLCSLTMENTDQIDVARTVGLGELTFFTQIPYGGGGACATVGLAAMAIATGTADVVVAWRARNRGSGGRPWAGNFDLDYANWTRPFGLVRPADEVAMLSRRYLEMHHVSREQLAAVALTLRAHANRNPRALFYDRPLSLDEYLSARWISEPLCLYDCSVETDGAVALVLTSAERARSLRQKPVYVHAATQGLNQQYELMANYYAEDPLRGPSSVAARKIWSKSSFGPADIDVVQIYDVFSPLVLMSLEAYGFCEPGEAAVLAASGGLSFDSGRVPTNTSGGSLSEAYVHGFNLITEGVAQLRGSSTAQVAGASTCLVASAECSPTSALLLRAE